MANGSTLFLIRRRTRRSEQLQVYGRSIPVTRVGIFNLIHFDKPGPDVIRERTAAFRVEQVLTDDCPLCRRLRAEGGDVLFGNPPPLKGELHGVWR